MYRGELGEGRPCDAGPVFLIGIFTKNPVLTGAAAFVLVLGLEPLRPALLLFLSARGLLNCCCFTVAVLAPLLAGDSAWLILWPLCFLLLGS